jgi:hypothetical protein
MFSIETKSGKFIQSHSYYKQEAEILLPPGIHLQVISKFSPAEGLHIIQLREISPPYKPLTDPFDLSQWKPVSPQPQPPSPEASPQEGKFTILSIMRKCQQNTSDEEI